jgi:hypothetical protein
LGQKALLGAQETSQWGANDQLEMTFSPQRFSEMSAGEFSGEKAFCCFLPPLYSPFAAAAVPENWPQLIAANPQDNQAAKELEKKNKPSNTMPFNSWQSYFRSLNKSDAANSDFGVFVNAFRENKLSNDRINTIIKDPACIILAVKNQHIKFLHSCKKMEGQGPSLRSLLQASLGRGQKRFRLSSTQTRLQKGVDYISHFSNCMLFAHIH